MAYYICVIFLQDIEVWAKGKFKVQTWKQWKRDVTSLLLETNLKQFNSKLQNFMGTASGGAQKVWHKRFQNYFRTNLEADVRRSCGAEALANGITFDFDSGVNLC